MNLEEQMIMMQRLWGRCAVVVEVGGFRSAASSP
jgi:hypothetical protein